MQITPIQISIAVMAMESIVLFIVMVGWYRGARRLDFKLHHLAVYSILLVHLFNVGLWMIPQALARAGTVSADPGQYWYVILHDSFGMLAVILAIVLVITFLVKKGMPLNLLRRARPLMITVLFLWIVTFVLGAYIFVGGLMTV